MSAIYNRILSLVPNLPQDIPKDPRPALQIALVDYGHPIVVVPVSLVDDLDVVTVVAIVVVVMLINVNVLVLVDMFVR